MSELEQACGDCEIPRIVANSTASWVKDVFQQTPVPMSTYLVAIAVSDFDYVEVTSQGGALIGNKKQVNN